MRPQRSFALPLAFALALGPAGPARAQSEPEAIELVLEPGTALRVALPDRVHLKQAGQALAGSLVEDVYAYDRVVLPAGTRVLGQVASFESVSGHERAGAIAGGDFTPLRRAVLQFDRLVLEDGREIAVSTEVRSATEKLVLSTREAPKKNLAQQAAEQVTAEASHAVAGVKKTVAEVKQPRKVDRLKHGLVMAMPYHPQYLERGTVYTASLIAPLGFGSVEPTEPAVPGTRPAPDSVLRARLLTALDSSKAQRGTPVEAVVTQPVFSEDHKLILPEGAVLKGEVTHAKPARRFHRSGQLRFLFETVAAPQREPETMRASLYSVQSARDRRIALDDEGGVSSVESKSRFVAPALASLAFVASMNTHLDYDTEGLGPETQYGTVGTRGLSGFFGWSLVGFALSQVSHPLAVAFGIIGIVRTVVPSVFGKGRDIVFPADTAMEVQLAAEPERSP
jgi:hypothetical protein